MAVPERRELWASAPMRFLLIGCFGLILALSAMGVGAIYFLIRRASPAQVDDMIAAVRVALWGVGIGIPMILFAGAYLIYKVGNAIWERAISTPGRQLPGFAGILEEMAEGDQFEGYGEWEEMVPVTGALPPKIETGGPP